MGWGEAHGGVVHGAGTTAQVAEAHNALDQLGVEAGPLARRVLVVYAKVHDLTETVAALTARVERLEAVEPLAKIPGDALADCNRTDVIEGAMPNAQWCPTHRHFHATAGPVKRPDPTMGLRYNSSL